VDVRITDVSTSSKDMGKKRIKALIKKLSKMKAHVGVPGDATPPVDADGKPVGISMAELAYIHEKGSPANKIPSRPLMHQTKTRVEKKFVRLLSNGYKRAIKGANAESILRTIGVAYEGEIKRSFVVETFVENTKATKKRKGSSRPLIDTGALRQSITSKVVRG
jgi:hypothetical protein